MSFISELRIALRSLRPRPGMVLAIVVTLALSVGANTAVFSVLHALILHPLAVDDPGRLLAIYTATTESPYGTSPLSTYDALASRHSSLAGVAAYATFSLPMGDGDPTPDLAVALVTNNYFALLGVRARLGRTIRAGDPDGPGANTVAVISNALWTRRFGADPHVVGKAIRIHGQVLTIVGVAPVDFQGTDLGAIPDLWVPVSAAPLLHIDLLGGSFGLNRALPLFSLVARLRDGVNTDDAAKEIALQLSDADVHPPHLDPVASRRGSNFSVLPLSTAAAAVRDRGSLYHVLTLLVAGVLLTSLLACLNVANLLFVRGHERAHELSVRFALGASPRRIAQHLFAESLLLALLGGCAGLVIAIGMVHLLSTLILPGHLVLSRVEMRINAPVLLFTCGMSLLTALGFGLAPVFRLVRLGSTSVLRQERGSSTTSYGRGLLLSVQVAISLVLLVSGSLFVQSVRAGLDTNIGFDPRPLAGVSVMSNQDGTLASNNAEYTAVIDALRHVPGILDAAASTHVPLSPLEKRPFGRGPAADTALGAPEIVMGLGHIAGDFFGTLGVPFAAGRPFTVRDDPEAPRVIILNETAARALWPTESPIGKIIHGRWFGPLWFTYKVVGVVRDTKYVSLADAHVPFAYVPLAQEDFARPVTFIGKSAEPRRALAAIQSTLASIAPDLRLPSTLAPPARLISQQVDMVLAPQRMAIAVLSGFALLALCVSAVGIYGSVAYATSRRTVEIGIRVALGARPVDVLGLVMTEAGVAMITGLIAGLCAVLVTLRYLGRFVYDAPTIDPKYAACAIAILGLVSILAAFIPSWRALRIDPLLAMRATK